MKQGCVAIGISSINGGPDILRSGWKRIVEQLITSPVLKVALLLQDARNRTHGGVQWLVEPLYTHLHQPTKGLEKQ